MSSLKSPRTTSYRSSIETIALNCLVFEKFAFCILATDRLTDIPVALSRSHYRERQLNKQAIYQPVGTFNKVYSVCNRLKTVISSYSKVHSSYAIKD